MPLLESLTFTKLKLVQNGSLSGGIETNHKYPHLLFTELLWKEQVKAKKHKCKIQLNKNQLQTPVVTTMTEAHISSDISQAP